MGTQVTTGKVRLSYCNLYSPKATNGQDKPKYSVTLLIPKTDTQTMKKIYQAIEEAKSRYIASGGKLSETPKTTIYDGDGERANGGEFSSECKGHYVINVSTKIKPVLVHADKTPITDDKEIYSGCYGRAIINFYVYDVNGNKSITASLCAIMKLYDGELLGGVTVTDTDWDDGWEDDEWLL